MKIVNIVRELVRSRFDRGGILLQHEFENELETVLKTWDWTRGQLVNTVGCAEPPVDPYLLAALAKCNGYHSNALFLKQSTTVGQGYTCTDALRKHIEYANDDQTFEDFSEELSLDLETYGSMYVEVKRNTRTASLHRSPALLTRVRPFDGGKDRQFVQFEQKMGVAMNAVAFDRFKPGMVSGIRQLMLARSGGDRWYGSPEYYSIKKLLTTNLSIVTLAEKWFENGLFLDKILVSKGGALTSDQKNMLRSFINKTLKGVDNANKAILLELGRQAELEVKSLGGEIKDSSFSELRKDNINEIAAGHRTNAKLIGTPSGAQLGASNEIDGLMRLFAITFVNSRRNKLTQFFRRLFRDCGFPDADSFSFNKLDTSAGETDAQTISTATGGAPWLSTDEARDEWFGEKRFTPSEAAAVTNFIKMISKKL